VSPVRHLAKLAVVGPFTSAESGASADSASQPGSRGVPEHALAMSIWSQKGLSNEFQPNGTNEV